MVFICILIEDVSNVRVKRGGPRVRRDHIIVNLVISLTKLCNNISVLNHMSTIILFIVFDDSIKCNESLS